MSEDVRHLGVSIAVPLARAYAFAHRPDNFPLWAAGLSSSLHHDGQHWVAQTPAGPAVVMFAPPNDYGILDHHVRIAGQPDIYIPLRMIAHGDGTQVVFTLFRQPDMNDAVFEADAQAVMADLEALKRLLEQAAG
ncbi:SRPBCC family protein [Sphingobium sp. WCS2017Hpa-17]|uniref:SRPBCC family protein n=1 Tax=Sphingobium sp. WCS2017Hpa-17 TaxID=3073638 RepID=UPI00288B6BBF|nr:SRPBCC family protein [Sphingobium sp. WCS2017Hpa-17]